MALVKPKRSLTAYKGHLTRATKSCETLLSQVSINKVEIEETIVHLKSRWNLYEEANNSVEEILLRADGDKIEIDKVQTEYCEIQVSCQQCLAKMRSASSCTEPDDSNRTTSRVSRTHLLPRLPHHQLPTFSGELIE